MNNYIITFKRSNGTIGNDTFTALTEGEARHNFKECYRHDVYTILSVVIEVKRNDIELVTKIEAMGTWESEQFNFDLYNSFDIWSFNEELYKIWKDSKRIE